MLPSLLLLTEGLVLLGIATLLLIVEPVGAVIVVIVLGSSAWLFQRSNQSRLARWGVARQHHEAFRVQFLQEGLGGAKDVKLLGREQFFLDRYSVHNAETARVWQLQQTLFQLPRLWLELIAVAALAILVWTMLAQGRELAVLMSTLGLFTAAAFRLLPSVNRALGAFQSLQYGLPAIDRLLGEVHEEVTAPSPATQPAAFDAAIDVQDVSYAYPGAGATSLANVTVTVRKGEAVGFIGPSGSGKSTLVDLILGLLTPNAGRVLVDGRDIQECLRSWQNRTGYVPQTVYLTDDTLRRNIAFGVPDAAIDNAAVQRAIAASQLSDFIAALPAGLDTVIGERGVRLSGGQRQRIGIARALYTDPDVLVLDEATSALDSATEQSVMDAVAALHGSKTLLVVAHRLSTVEYCDRIYRLDHGRVIDVSVPAKVPGNVPVPNTP
jgi:ABC-type multidrug transport system fused ATPase/permease subunit